MAVLLISGGILGSVFSGLPGLIGTVANLIGMGPILGIVELVVVMRHRKRMRD